MQPLDMVTWVYGVRRNISIRIAAFIAYQIIWSRNNCCRKLWHSKPLTIQNFFFNFSILFQNLMIPNFSLNISDKLFENAANLHIQVYLVVTLVFSKYVNTWTCAVQHTSNIITKLGNVSLIWLLQMLRLSSWEFQTCLSLHCPN